MSMVPGKDLIIPQQAKFEFYRKQSIKQGIMNKVLSFTLVFGGNLIEVAEIKGNIC